MMQSKPYQRVHEQSYSSRIKLRWLALLLLVGVIISVYFSYSTNFDPREVTPTRSEYTVSIVNFNREVLLSGGDGDIGGNLSTQSSQNTEEYEGNLEEVEFINETDSEIDYDYLGSNSSLLEGETYNTTTGEFGVVFSEPSNESDDLGDEDEVESLQTETNDSETRLESDEKQKVSNVASIVDDIQLHGNTTTILEAGHDARNSKHQSIPKFNNHKTLFDRMKTITNHSNPHCDLSTPFSSWEKGVVTQLGMPIKKDCMKLRTNTKRETQRVGLQSQVKQWKSTKPWEHFALKYKGMSCEDIRHDFQHNFYVSEVEKNFPIAYIFVVYTNAGQVLRLLKAIYRPQNLYCIHPDAKQGKKFTELFKNIARCLDNVFVVSKQLRVYYAHHSIMDSQLNCMRDLMKYPATRWKYVINLCGRELPLKTNREIVKSLQKLKGYSGLNLRHLTPNFWNSRFRYKYSLNRRGKIRRTHKRLGKPPIKVYKSMNFMAASRAFVFFLLHDPISQTFRKYVSPVYAPEEHFYSSLFALPRAKGARPPNGLISRNDMPEVDAFIWINNRWQVHQMKSLCPGRRIVHGICILSGPDLGRIEKLGISSKHPVFFFNKYFLEWDPTPMDCMEEELVRTNMEEYWQDCVAVQRHRN